MKWKSFVRIGPVFALAVAVTAFYWPDATAAYRAAYPGDPLRAHTLADCARMNPQFNRFWMADRTMCYEGHRLAKQAATY
jgi:hypothetical protein